MPDNLLVYEKWDLKWVRGNSKEVCQEYHRQDMRVNLFILEGKPEQKEHVYLQ